MKNAIAGDNIVWDDPIVIDLKHEYFNVQSEQNRHLIIKVIASALVGKSKGGESEIPSSNNLT